MADDPATRAAIGAVIAARRRACGWSQLDLARRLCAVAGRATVTRTEVARWERGARSPSPYWRGPLSRVLGIAASRLRPGSVAPAGEFGARAGPDQPVRSARRSTRSELGWLIRAGQASQDWLLAEAGGRAPRGQTGPAGVAIRTAVLLGADGRSMAERTWHELIGAGAPAGPLLLAGLARLYAHAAADHPGPALAAGVSAIEAALATGALTRPDRLSGARLLGRLSGLAIRLDEPELAVRLAGTARLAAGRSAPGTAAWLDLHRCLALAAAGAPDAARRALRRAEATPIRGLADPPGADDEPGAEELAGLAGRCHAVLGQPDLAVPLLRRAWPESVPAAQAGPRDPYRSAVWFAADLARAQLSGGDRAAARGTVSAAIPVAIRYAVVPSARELLALQLAPDPLADWARRSVRWNVARARGPARRSRVSVAA